MSTIRSPHIIAIIITDLASIVGFEPTSPDFKSGILPLDDTELDLRAGIEPASRGSRPRDLPLVDQRINYAQAT